MLRTRRPIPAVIRHAAAAALGLAALATLPACREKGYAQYSPDDVVKSAQLMVKNGETAKLATLIDAEGPYLPAFLRRVGTLLADTQALADEINRKFPADVAKLKDRLEQGGAKGLLDTVASLTNQRALKGTNPGAAIEDAFKQIFVDPYGWIENSTGHFSFEDIGNDRVAVLWDKKPIMAPLGLVMRQRDGKWFVALPLNSPLIAPIMPRTKDEWSIWASLVKVFDNAVIDLRKDIQSGQMRSFDDVVRKAGEKAFMPAVMVAFAMGKSYELRKQQEQPAKK